MYNIVYDLFFTVPLKQHLFLGGFGLSWFTRYWEQREEKLDLKASFVWESVEGSG